MVDNYYGMGHYGTDDDDEEKFIHHYIATNVD